MNKRMTDMARLALRVARLAAAGCVLVVPLAHAQATAPAAAAAPAASAAQAPRVPVLDRVRAGEPLRLGYRESSIPFSYVLKSADPNTPPKPVGYALEICQRLADVVARAAGQKAARVELVPVTAANRISLVESGAVDMECGSTTNNAERRQRVDFTIPHFITGARLLVRKESPFTRLEDLQGKKVVSTQGSTPLKTLEALNRTRALGVTVMTSPDHGRSVEMVERGEADAFIMDDVLLFGLAASRPDPAALKVVGRFVTTEPLAIMLPKGDAAFKKIVDDEMRRLIYSREINALYDRWFMQPIPPGNKPLNLPQSYLLRDFWKYPTDKVPF